MLRRAEGRAEGLHPWGITSSLGYNFSPGSEWEEDVKNWPKKTCLEIVVFKNSMGDL
jgi:hypothetical protein